MTSSPSSFGGAVRRLRTDAGMSLTALAQRVHYSKGHLSKIETGRRGYTELLARACDEALGAGGVLIDLARPGNARPALAEPSGADSLTMADLVSMITELGRDEHTSWPDDEDVRAETLRVTFADLRRQGQQLDPTFVLRLFAHQVRALLAMAGGPGPVRDRFAARCAEFAGWMAQERGDDKGARLLTHAAMVLADRAGDRDLVAHTWVRQAEMELYRREPRAVLQFSDRAQLDGEVSPRVRALGACTEAHGHAILGDARACDSAIGRAGDLLAQDHEARDGFTIGSSTVEDLVEVTAGWCDLELGRPERAVEKLQRAVHRLPVQARRARGLFGARACAAYAAMGEPDLACELGRGPLAEVRMTRSAAAISQWKVVHDSLRRWDHRGSVRDFNADLNDVLNYATRAGNRRP